MLGPAVTTQSARACRPCMSRVVRVAGPSLVARPHANSCGNCVKSCRSLGFAHTIHVPRIVVGTLFPRPLEFRAIHIDLVHLVAGGMPIVLEPCHRQKCSPGKDAKDATKKQEQSVKEKEKISRTERLIKVANSKRIRRMLSSMAAFGSSCSSQMSVLTNSMKI